MSNRDIQKDMDVLRSLLPLLREHKIYAIEFGDPERPKGFLTHHRIRHIPTQAGDQICFRLVSRGIEGSGFYMGQPTDREIEIQAQTFLEKYFAPTPFSEQLNKLRAARATSMPSDKLTYFVVEKED